MAKIKKNSQQTHENRSITEFLRGNILKIFGIAVAVFLVCLLFVQIPYWIGSINPLVITDFSANAVLGFLGGYVSAVGTIFLSWIAIKQADKASDISNRTLQLEEARYIERHKPVIVVNCAKLHSDKFNGIALKKDYPDRVYRVNSNNPVNGRRACIEIEIINTGCTGIYNCEVIEIKSIPEEMELDNFSNFNTACSTAFNLLPSEQISLNLYLHTNAIERFARKEVQSMEIEFVCTNDFNEQYRMMLKITGNIALYGNRYEDMLTPTPHPIKWKVSVQI